MQIDKAFDGIEQAVAQAAFVCATRAGRNQVDITFAHWRTVFGERQTPLRALAFGKAFVATVGETFPFKQRNKRVGMQGLHEVIAQAAFVNPRLCFLGLFLHQCHAHTGHQHRFAAQ